MVGGDVYEYSPTAVGVPGTLSLFSRCGREREKERGGGGGGGGGEG